MWYKHMVAMDEEEQQQTTAQAVTAGEFIEVLLIRVGDDPGTIAEILGEVMSVTITDLQALMDSVPIVLFKEMGHDDAQDLCFRLQQAGATVTLKEPRP